MQTLKIRTVKYRSSQSVVCRICRAEQTEQQCSESADAVFGFLVVDFHSETLYAKPQHVLQPTRHTCNACRLINYSIINRNFQNVGSRRSTFFFDKYSVFFTSSAGLFRFICIYLFICHCWYNSVGLLCFELKDDQWIINWKGCGRKRLCSALRFCPGICLEVLRTTESPCQGIRSPSIHLGPS